jgi:hypothetical protein
MPPLIVGYLPLLLLLACTYVVILLFPADWWQKSPRRQPHRWVGKWLGKHLDISLRNVFLRITFLALVVSTLAGLLPFFLLWLTVLGPIVGTAHLCARALARLKGTSPEGPPFWGLLLMWVMLWVAGLGLLGPVRVMTVALFVLLGKPVGGTLEGFATETVLFGWDIVIGITGLVVVVAWLLLDAFWRLRQARQVENLPTSKARSVALGLVELQGIVRSRDAPVVSLRWDMFDYLAPKQEIVPFHLEDATGRVLVDPRGCRVRAGWVTDIRSASGVREIVLTRRVKKIDKDDSVTRTLMPGDPVYLVGNAEINPEAPSAAVDSERIVIRPSAATTWDGSLWRFLFGAIRPLPGKDIFNVFFLSDTDEARARRHILRGLRMVWSIACLWAVLSIGLIWSTSWEGRHVRAQSWRQIYWSGAYTQRDAFRRFAAYVDSLAPHSAEAIPALIEALGYEDRHFRSKASEGLFKLHPTHRTKMKAAVPVFVEILKRGNNETMQDTILALRALGPEANAVVPALIDALSHFGSGNEFPVPDFVVRFQAAEALGAIGPAAQAAVPALQRALDDRHSAVRKAAQHALKRIGHDPDLPPEPPLRAP